MISEAYAQQNQDLHASHPRYGTSGHQWAAYIEALLREDGHTSVLDYGAGKGTLASALGHSGIAIAEYDPAVPGKQARPEPADLVVITDVLEHIEPAHLDNLLADLARLTHRKLFFDVCTVASLKTLPDGRNAHLIVQSPDWWRYKLTRNFDIVHWVERPECNLFYGEAVPKGQGAAYLAERASKPRRRKLTLELSAMCERLRQVSAANCDALSRISSVRCYEGIDDERADLQIVFDLLDDMDDDGVLRALRDVARLANKGIMLRAALTETRTEDWWKARIEAHWRLTDWVPGPGTLGLMAMPKVGVHGVKAIGAVEHDERWGQVEAALKRTNRRITCQNPHRRKAILACYGPSLGDYITRLSDERMEHGADVISVSGAHDFLLEHGIVPRYHVECDPRPHKADNIDRPHPGIQYLIGSVVHPTYFDKLDGHNVALWHVADEAHCGKLLKLGEKGHHMITGGGSVGLRAIALLYAMGYRDFSIYGMDCSFADNGEQQWAGKHAGKRQDVMTAVCGGKAFATSPVLLTYATDFIEMAQKMTAQLRVYGDGLLSTMCAVHAGMAAYEQSINGDQAR